MTVNEQIINVIIMTISGIFIGTIIDLFRTMVEEMSPKSFFRKYANGLELLVWALLGVGTFIILFLIKGGEWRLVDPLAQICGIFLYESTFQPLFRLIGKIIFILFIKPIVLIFQLVGAVIKGVFRLLHNIILIIFLPFRWFYNKFIRKFIHKYYVKSRKSIFKN